MKRFNVIVVAVVVIAALGGFALAKGMSVNGKVAAVDGNKITIEVEAGKAAEFKVGSEVKLEAAAAKAETPAAKPAAKKRKEAAGC
jgi:hypothetical protein